MAHWATTIFAAAFAAHSLLGCCLHHAHACPPRCSNAEGSFASCDEPASHAADDCAPHEPSDEHRGPDHCRGESCVYVARGCGDSEASSLPGEYGAYPPPILVATAIGPEATAIGPEATACRRPDVGNHCKRVRLHLLHQVLLI